MLENYTTKKDKEFFCNAIIGNLCNIFSPFEICEDIDFPKKEELGGIVLKFIGGGAAYFKIQKEMPSDEELKSIYEVGNFLNKSFGDYVVIEVLCMPHIEIRDIKLSKDEKNYIDFISSRKNNGDAVLEGLIKKLESQQGFTIDDHILRIIVQFMSRKDNDEFEKKYSRFLTLYEQSGIETPDVSELSKTTLSYNRWF